MATLYRRYETNQNRAPTPRASAAPKTQNNTNRSNYGSFYNASAEKFSSVENFSYTDAFQRGARNSAPSYNATGPSRQHNTRHEQPRHEQPRHNAPPVHIEPEPPKPKKKGNPLLSFIPETIYNPETKKIFGVLSADDLLILALIILFLDSDEEGDNLMVLALAFILVSEWFDFDLSKFGL